LNSGHAESIELLKEVNYYLGKQYVAEGNYSKAVSCFEAAQNYEDSAVLLNEAKAIVAEAQAKAEAAKEAERKRQEREKVLVGKWKYKVLYEEFYADGTVVEYDDERIYRKGTYHILGSEGNYRLRIDATEESKTKYGGYSGEWPIEFVSDKEFKIFYLDRATGKYYVGEHYKKIY